MIIELFEKAYDSRQHLGLYGSYEELSKELQEIGLTDLLPTGNEISKEITIGYRQYCWYVVNDNSFGVTKHQKKSITRYLKYLESKSVA